MLLVQSAIYGGYGLGHDLLSLFVSNEDGLPVETIDKGVRGFLWLMLFLGVFSIIAVLLSFQNTPGPKALQAKKELEEMDQTKLTLSQEEDPNSDQFSRSDALSATLDDGSKKISIISKSISESESQPTSLLVDKSNLEKAKESSHSEEDSSDKKSSFTHQLPILLKDPVFLLLFLGAPLGTNIVGGQNVAMATMLKTFGVPEVDTLRLANAGMAGAILGLIGYFFLVKRFKDTFTNLLFILFAL